MSTLEIKDLYAHVETKDGIKPILKGVNLTVNSGETHAIMGPNGSGKSTLAYTLAGHPKYIVDSGQVLLDGEDILKMTPDERAKAGIFLAMQYPVEVPGVSMTNFLRTAKTKVDGKAPAIRTWCAPGANRSCSWTRPPCTPCTAPGSRLGWRPTGRSPRRRGSTGSA